MKDNRQKVIDGLKNKPKISINPPPQDKRCECCGKDVNELKSFGGKGDPLMGNFKGAKLVKTFRESCGYVGASWECRNCICLDDKKYKEVRKGEKMK